MKKISICLLLFIVLIGTNIFGYNLPVSCNKTTMYVGETATITVNGSNIVGRFDFSSSSNVSLSTSVVFVDNNSSSVTVKANSAGTATVTVSTSNSATYDEEEFSGSKTFTITVKEKEEPVTTTPPSNNTTNNPAPTTTASSIYLKSLRLDVEGMTPSFSSYVDDYAVTIPSNVNSINVSAVPIDSESKVSVYGNDNLQIGTNKITVKVTSNNGTYWEYYINVTKADNPAKSNAYLENLVIDYVDIDFSSEKLDYDVGDLDLDIESLTILPFKMEDGQTVEIIGNKLEYGENVIKIKVTAKDNTTTNEYKIKLNFIKKEEVEEEETEEDIDIYEEIDIYKYEDVNGNNYKFKSYALYIFISISVIEFIIILYMYNKYNDGKLFRKSEEKGRRRNN